MSALFVLAKLTREQIRPAQPKYLVCSTARMLRSASEALQYGWTIMLHYLEQQRSHSKANREQEQGSRSLVLSSGRKLLKLMTLIWASRVTRNLHMFSPNSCRLSHLQLCSCSMRLPWSASTLMLTPISKYLVDCAVWATACRGCRASQGSHFDFAGMRRETNRVLPMCKIDLRCDLHLGLSIALACSERKRIKTLRIPLLRIAKSQHSSNVCQIIASFNVAERMLVLSPRGNIYQYHACECNQNSAIALAELC